MIRAALLVLLALAAACSEPGSELPPLEFETSHSVIGVGPDEAYPLCAADTKHVDAQIDLVASRLETEPTVNLEIYILDHLEGPFHVDRWCGGEHFLGCYSPGEDRVYSIWSALDHELVHAVARNIEFPSLAWSEGTAEMLAGKRTFKSDEVVLEPEYLERETLPNYITVSHFARFLVETRGWARYNRAIRGEPLGAVYGETPQELTDDYERTAPYSYPAMTPCPYPPLLQVEDGAWRESFVISCDSQEATQFESVGHSQVADAAVLRTVSLTPGTYAFEQQGGTRLLALRCQTESEDEPNADPFADGVRIEGYGAPSEFAAGVQHVVQLAGGTYWIAAASGSLERTSVDLAVTRLD